MIYIDTTEGEGRERGLRWTPHQAHSAIPPTIELHNTQEIRAETPEDQKLSQALPHSVRVHHGACEAGKATKAVLISCMGRGREAVHACGA